MRSVLADADADAIEARHRRRCSRPRPNCLVWLRRHGAPRATVRAHPRAPPAPPAPPASCCTPLFRGSPSSTCAPASGPRPTPASARGARGSPRALGQERRADVRAGQPGPGSGPALGRDQECRAAHSTPPLTVAARDGVGAARPARPRRCSSRLELSRSTVGEAVRPTSRPPPGIAAGQGTFRKAAIHGWPPDLVEAYVRAGRTAEASALLDRFAEAPPAASRSGRPGRAPAVAACWRPRTRSTRRSPRPSRCTRRPGCRSTWPAPSSATASGCAAQRRRIEAREQLRAVDRGLRAARRRAVADRARTELAATGQTAAPRRGRPLRPPLTGAGVQVALMGRRRAPRTARLRSRCTSAEDHRVPPALRLPQARDPLARGAGPVVAAKPSSAAACSASRPPPAKRCSPTYGSGGSRD